MAPTVSTSTLLAAFYFPVFLPYPTMHMSNSPHLQPERVSGLLSLMAEEGVVPTAAVWEVQLAHWAARGDAGQLANVATVMRQQQVGVARGLRKGCL